MPKSPKLARLIKKQRLVKKYAAKRAALRLPGDFDGLQKLRATPHLDGSRVAARSLAAPRLYAGLWPLLASSSATWRARADPGRQERIMVSDRVGDFIIRLQNARDGPAKKDVVAPILAPPRGNRKELKELGYVASVEADGDPKKVLSSSSHSTPVVAPSSRA